MRFDHDAFFDEITKISLSTPAAAALGGLGAGGLNVLKQKGEMHSGAQERLDPYRAVRAGVLGAGAGAGATALHQADVLGRAQAMMGHTETAAGDIAAAAARARKPFWGLFSKA